MTSPVSDAMIERLVKQSLSIATYGSVADVQVQIARNAVRTALASFDAATFAVLVDGLHAQIFGVHSLGDPELSHAALADDGIIHEAAHALLRSLPSMKAKEEAADQSQERPDYSNQVVSVTSAGRPEAVKSADQPPADDVERVARAICEANGAVWCVGTHKLMTGQNFTMEDHELDPYNNHWRHIARAALSAIRNGDEGMGS